MKMSVAVKRFVEFLAVRGCDSKTIAAYRRDLLLLCGHMADPEVVGVSRAMLIDFFSDVGRMRLAATVNRMKSAVRQFFKFLLEEDLILRLPVSGLHDAKIVRKSPPYLSEEETGRLLKYLSVAGRERERFLFKFIFNTGLRISEACSLDVSGVDGRKNVEVVGKGKKVRIIPLSERLQNDIESYLEWRRNRKLTGRSLLVNLRGKPLTRRGALFLWKKCLRGASIGRDLRLHDLRHTFGTLAYRKSRDLRGVQELLGHSSPQTTQIYTHVDREELRKIVERL